MLHEGRWFPGSAWEPTAARALPRESIRHCVGLQREAEPRKAAHSQAEPGNEECLALQHNLHFRTGRAQGRLLKSLGRDVDLDVQPVAIVVALERISDKPVRQFLPT